MMVSLSLSRARALSLSLSLSRSRKLCLAGLARNNTSQRSKHATSEEELHQELLVDSFPQAHARAHTHTQHTAFIAELQGMQGNVILNDQENDLRELPDVPDGFKVCV
jgi:hypothetical protein